MIVAINYFCDIKKSGVYSYEKTNWTKVVSSDFSKTSPDYSNASGSDMVSNITHFQQQSIFETY